MQKPFRLLHWNNWSLVIIKFFSSFFRSFIRSFILLILWFHSWCGDHESRDGWLLLMKYIHLLIYLRVLKFNPHSIPNTKYITITAKTLNYIMFTLSIVNICTFYFSFASILHMFSYCWLALFSNIFLKSREMFIDIFSVCSTY